MINKKLNRMGWKILVVWVVWFLTGCAPLSLKGEAEEKARLEEKRVAAVDPAVVVPPLFFSPDGEHAVWVHRTGEQFQVVLDGVAGPPFENIAKGPVVLSPDGRHLAYLVENKESRHLSVVVDGVPGPEFDTIGPVQFHFEKKDGPGRISYLGLRGQEIIQVSQALD